MDRVMLRQPLLDLFFLRGENNALPAYLTRTLTIFGHDIRTFVEDLDQAIGLGALEMIRGGSRVVFLHTTL